MQLVSPRACRRIGWEAGDGHGQAVCSATRACLMDRAAQGTIAVLDHVPYQCCAVVPYVCVWLWSAAGAV